MTAVALETPHPAPAKPIEGSPPMLMRHLFEGDLAAFLDRAAVGSNLCVLVHVPKTAGSSLRTELAALLQPDVNIEVNYNDPGRSFHECMDASVEAFIARAKTDGVRFGSGHIMGRHVQQIRNSLPQCRIVTMLRDPLDRVISDYRYQRSPAHPPSAAFIRTVPDFAAYLRIEGQQNKCARHLLPHQMVVDGDPERAIDFILTNYDFVGIQEMYALSFGILTSMIGAPRSPSVRKNVNSEASTTIEVDEQLAGAVRAANRMDVAIYEYFSRRLTGMQPALSRDLAERGVASH